jgi:hypothetical protein
MYRTKGRVDTIIPPPMSFLDKYRDEITVIGSVVFWTLYYALIIWYGR